MRGNLPTLIDKHTRFHSLKSEQEEDSRRGFRCLRRVIGAVGLLLALAGAAWAQLGVGMETGAVISGYNDVRVPKEEGTALSLSDQLSTKTKPFVRLRVSYLFARRHWLSLLVAPLSVEARGSVGSAVHFDGADFPAHAPLVASYRFDSYRLTYRYLLRDRGATRLAVGITAKIRDAAIRLEGSGISGETTNTGFVPLLSGRFEWWPGQWLGVILDVDAAAAPQGRAEDALVAVAYVPRRHLQLYSGYRILEGGADVEQVYNFALFHYLCLGATWTF